MGKIVVSVVRLVSAVFSQFAFAGTALAGAALAGTVFVGTGHCLGADASDRAERPNILWLTTEDIGPHLGCYGDPDANTPNLDAFAARSLTYDVAWSNYPVCAPARTTIITGVYAAATGGGHMRSEVRFPKAMKFFPQFLRDAGYYCTNNSKTDYNHPMPGKVWDESSRTAHYRNREKGQPFFAVFNHTGTHESKIRVRPHEKVLDPATVHLPAYHPDCPESRQDWAQYHDNIARMDGWFAKHLEELDKAGLADNTIVIFFGDHGSGMPRHKRFPGNSGLQVPMIVHVPEALREAGGGENLAPKGYRPGARTRDPFCFVDLAPSMLSLAGIPVADYMQGYAAMGKFRTEAPRYAYGFRGRMDGRADCVRSIRDDRYVYIRNFMLSRVHGQRVSYQFQTPTTRVWHDMFRAGKLNKVQSRFWEKREAEELYDLQSDPDETRNLAGDPQHGQTLTRFRNQLREHTLAIRDVALLPEPIMNALEADQAPYDYAQSDAYALEAMFDLATDAMQRDAEVPARVRNALTSEKATDRYWGAAGILAREQPAVDQFADQLRAMLDDSCATVRITAAEALARHGSPEDRERAIGELMQDADCTHSSNFDSVWALNALDLIGVSDAQRKAIAELPKSDPNAARRSREYIGRMIQALTSRSATGQQPEANRQSGGD